MWDVRTADPWHSWLGRLHLCDPNPVPSVPDPGIVVFRIRIRAISCYVPKPDPGLVPVDRYYGFGSEPWVSMSRIRIRIWIRPGGLSYLYIVLRFFIKFSCLTCYFVWFVAGQNNAVRSFNVEGNFVERGQHELQHLLSTHEMESSEFLTIPKSSKSNQNFN